MQIIPGKKKTVLLVSELTNNPGPSVANSAKSIWYAFFAKDLLDRVSTDWALLIEHYSNKNISGCGSDIYEHIDIETDNTERRNRLSREEIVHLAGISSADLDIAEEILHVTPNELEIVIGNDSHAYH